MVKRLVCTVLAVLLLIGAASCSQTESPAESAASSKSLKESLLPAALRRYRHRNPIFLRSSRPPARRNPQIPQSPAVLLSPPARRSKARW